MSAIVSGLIGAAIATGLALLAERGRKKAHEDGDGWKSLYPGWYVHSVFIGCTALVALFAFFLLSGGSARSDAESQNLFALVLLIAFGFGALYVAWYGYGRTIAWKGGKIRIKDIFGREVFHTLADVRQIIELVGFDGYEIKFADGASLKFSKHMHGVPEFVRHLPPSKF